MTRLAKYLKPFSLLLAISFALLFGQAMCDLALPNYMSDIVNVGLQHNGIEDVSPKAISRDGMEFMKAFMSGEQKTLVGENYSPVKGNDKYANQTYADVFQDIGDGAYAISDVSGDTLAQLDEAFEQASWILISVMRDIAEQSGREINAGEGNQFDSTSVEVSEMYAALPMLPMMQPEIDAARKESAETPEEIRGQMATALTQGFYKEIGFDLVQAQRSYIITVGLWMLLIALIGGVATILVGLLSSRIASGFARDLRRDLFNKVSGFSNAQMDKFSTASLITRTTNDIAQLQMFLTIAIRMLCYAPIMCIGGIVMAVGKSPSMSWIIALAGLILVALIVVIYIVAMPKFKSMQKLVDKLNLVSRENLSGLPVIRAFGTREHEEERFDEANTDLTKTGLFVNRVMIFMMPIMMLIMNGISLLVVWVGAHQISDAAMQIGDLMAFIQYAMQIIMSFLFVAMIFVFAPRAAVSAGRIADVLGTQETVKDKENTVSFDGIKKGLLEFRNVNFRYGGAQEDALHDLSFTAQPGETTAIIGPTGSGKSTVANLMLRFYDVTGGQILFDGVDIRDVAQKDLRDRIGYVPQKGVLLSGTIESNLKYGSENASDSDVEEAAEIAQAESFINEKPERFQSHIAQSGSNVSGGQKQRLSIARALVKKPEMFIFDDSFSALDYKTDVAVRRALKEKTGHSTVIIVTQRVSTVMHAEQILVLDDGVIVGSGTHRELLNSCPEYMEIASSQLSKEELA